jgi:hypothetical protein
MAGKVPTEKKMLKGSSKKKVAPPHKKTKNVKKVNKSKTKQTKKTKYMKGGRVHMPGAYFGTPNPVFSESAVAGYENFAYGTPVPVSFGVIHNGQTGPNLGVFPNASGMQTGGCGCGGSTCGLVPGGMTGGARKKRNSKKSRKH